MSQNTNDKFDPYDILGVDKNADLVTIEKSFKKLAIKYHPDKNKDQNATEIYQKLSKAKDILTDPEKREKYDKYGICDESDEIKLNEQMAQDYMIKHRLKKVIQINITINEALNGFQKTLRLEREIIDTKTRKRIIEQFEIVIKFDSTIPINKPMIFNGKGTKLDNNVGDLIIMLNINPDNTYKVNRSNFNLITKQKISIAQSLCGFEMVIPHINGKPITIRYDKIIKPDNIYIIKKMGLTIHNGSEQLIKTDIEIHFDIQYDISEQTIKKLKHAFNYNYIKSEATNNKQICNIEEYKVESDDEKDEQQEIFEHIFGNGPEMNFGGIPGMNGIPGMSFANMGGPNVRTRVYRSSSNEGPMPVNCAQQ